MDWESYGCAILSHNWILPHPGLRQNIWASGLCAVWFDLSLQSDCHCERRAAKIHFNKQCLNFSTASFLWLLFIQTWSVCVEFVEAGRCAFLAIKLETSGKTLDKFRDFQRFLHLSLNLGQPALGRGDQTWRGAEEARVESMHFLASRLQLHLLASRLRQLQKLVQSQKWSSHRFAFKKVPTFTFKHMDISRSGDFSKENIQR